MFAALDSRECEGAFRHWVGQLVPTLGADTVVAIDGKTSRRSTTKADANPLHMVSAFAADIGLVLGQTATAEKSNEITAIPGFRVAMGWRQQVRDFLSGYDRLCGIGPQEIRNFSMDEHGLLLGK